MALSRLVLTWALCFSSLAVACGDKEGEGTDGTDAADAADGGDGAEDSGEPQETVYPTGTRILLYYGNGGYPLSGAGKAAFETIDAHWKDSYGWNTDHRDAWTEDLSDYRMVGLVAPGYNDDTAFTSEEIAVFAEALANGTRIVIFGDREACGAGVAPALVEALGLRMAFTGASASLNAVVQADDFNRSHQVSAGLEAAIRMKEPCYVDPTSGSAVVRDNNNNVLVAAAQVGNGGDVVLVGDFQFMDDASGYLDQGDTQAFADNLAIVDPSFGTAGERRR